MLNYVLCIMCNYMLSDYLDYTTNKCAKNPVIIVCGGGDKIYLCMYS